MASVALWCEKHQDETQGGRQREVDADACKNPLLTGPFGFGSRCVRFPAPRALSANVGDGGEVSRAAMYRTIRVDPPKVHPTETHRYVAKQSSDHWGSEVSVRHKLDSAADRRRHWRPASRASGTGTQERMRPAIDPTSAGPGAYQPERTEVRLRPFTPTSELERYLKVEGGDAQKLQLPSALLLPGAWETDAVRNQNRPSSSMSIGRCSVGTSNRPLSVLSSPGAQPDLQMRFHHRAESEACADVWRLPFTTKQKLRDGPPNAFSLTSDAAAARNSFFTQRMTKSCLSGHCSKLELQLAATRPLTYVAPLPQVAPTHNRLIQLSSARGPRSRSASPERSPSSKDGLQ